MKHNKHTLEMVELTPAQTEAYGLPHKSAGPSTTFREIHIRTDEDMDTLWHTYGMACYHLGDQGIILVDHRVPDSHTA